MFKEWIPWVMFAVVVIVMYWAARRDEMGKLSKRQKFWIPVASLCVLALAAGLDAAMAHTS